jgi:ComF family protein
LPEKSLKKLLSPEIKNCFSKIITLLQDAVFPEKCLICGNFLKNKKEKELSQNFYDKTFFDFQNLMRGFLCPVCMKGFIPVEPPFCTVCGIMFKGREGENHVCSQCLDNPKKFRMARASGIYDREFMGVIHCLKYKEKIQLAKPLGMLLFSTFIKFWDIKSIDTVIPVPLHIKRFRKRGFNQAYLLVKDWKQLGKMFNIALSGIKIEKDALIRTRWTDPQTGLERKKRMTNIKNAFAVNNQAAIKNKRILLVDDVHTTGATANECAKVLLRSKAQYVDVLTLARAV